MKSVFSANTLDHDPYLVRGTHGNQLERWLGAETVALISQQMRGWYGPPIPVAGVPGRVYACGDGDFCGPIKGGFFGNLADYGISRFRRAMRNAARRGAYTLHGFSSLSDLISEMTTGGKKQTILYNKTGVAQPAAGASAFLWRMANTVPGAGANAAAAPGGTAFTRTSAGALGPQTNAGVGDTLNFINWLGINTVGQTGALMLFDYLFGVNINYNTTSNTVSGVPTRYQTAGTAPGNFMSANVTTVLGAGAQTITVTYTDQDGNSSTSPGTAIRASSAVDTIPHTQPVWNVPLAAGDTGIRAFTNIAFNVGVSGGFADRIIGHPIAIMPNINVANAPFFLDGINSAANFEQIYDDACLSLMEFVKGATALNTYHGYITLASG